MLCLRFGPKRRLCLSPSNFALATRSMASPQSFSDKMKAMEKGTKVQLNPLQPCIIRIDGHRFSVLTRNFQKPFDPRIHDAMIKTSEALMKAFLPAVVYTFSDEISLIFPVLPDIPPASPQHGDRIAAKQADSPLPFSNKLEKIISISAGLASSTFALHLYNQLTPEEKEVYEAAPPHFDSRAFNVPKNLDVYENLKWRQSDCHRNSIGLLSHTMFSHSLTQGVSCEEQLQMQLANGRDWEQMPPAYKYGTFIKRQRYIKDVEVKGEHLKVERTRFIQRSGILPSLGAGTGKLQQWLFSKLLEEQDEWGADSALSK